MRTFKVLAGDFRAGQGQISEKELKLWKPGSTSPMPDAKFNFWAIKSIDVATEQSVKRLGSALGWGALGVLALGPVGAVAAVLGGQGKDVTFIVSLHDGRRILAKADARTYEEFLAKTFK